MPTAHEVQQALARISDATSLVNVLLRDTLAWPIENKIAGPEEITFN
jgi:hypothetical protein